MIIGISGKLNSGKDTVGQIIKIILDNPHLNNEGILSFIKKEVYNNEKSPYYSSWEIKKFADKLKDIVCMLIGCTREQLEDREFKEKELGEEWWYYTRSFHGNIAQDLIPYTKDFYHKDLDKMSLIKMTPRLLLQLLGTECGRQTIHPNIWVNALMANYIEDIGFKYVAEYDPIFENDIEPKGESEAITVVHDYPGIKNKIIKVYLSFPPQKFNNGFPNWIITDMRFPNELKAVKDRGGITIRIDRKIYLPGGGQLGYKEHESETALDDAEFDYVIDNSGSLEELVEKVREILIKEKLL